MVSNCSGTRSCYPCGCFSPAPTPTGPAVEPGISAFGGVYSNGISSRFFTDEPQNIDMPGVMPALNVGYDFSDTLATFIEISMPGSYEISYSLGYDSGITEPLLLQANALRNGNTMPGGNIFITSTDTTSGDNYLRLSNTFIANLAAGDRISLAVSSAGAPFSNNISGARMTVKLLGTGSANGNGTNGISPMNAMGRMNPIGGMNPMNGMSSAYRR